MDKDQYESLVKTLARLIENSRGLQKHRVDLTAALADMIAEQAEIGQDDFGKRLVERFQGTINSLGVTIEEHSKLIDRITAMFEPTDQPRN